MTSSAEHERIEAVCAKTTFDEIENLGIFSRFVNNPTLCMPLYVGARRQGVSRSKCWIECDRLKAVVQHGLNRVTRKCIGHCLGAQIVVVGAQVLGSLSPRALDFDKLDGGFQNAHDRLGDPILQVEQVFLIPLLRLGDKPQGGVIVH